MFEALKKYAVFSGRSTRKEFWLFFLLFVIAVMLATFLDSAMGTIGYIEGFGLITAVTYLALLIPSISVAVRRLHDINKSGWWYLLYIVPLLGLVFYIYWNVKPSDDGENRFGPNPHDS